MKFNKTNDIYADLIQKLNSHVHTLDTTINETV